MMIKGLFNLAEIDLKEFGEIGLLREGAIALEEADLEALLAGRRTEMMELKDLFVEGFHITSLNAKLSLQRDADGFPELLIHPRYKEKQAPTYLTDSEAEALESGEVANVAKWFTLDMNNTSKMLVEFDRETNEYIVTDADQILVPDMVNGEELSLDQKERYRKGKEVELKDGTKFQYAGTERQGIRANKIALIASLLIDGGISYLLYQGLNALFGKKHDAQAAQMSNGYRKAFSELKKSEDEPEAVVQVLHPDKKYSREYGRNGTSR
jgi:hypothetical protein